MTPKEQTARAVVTRLHEANHEAYFAGGCVRDKLRGIVPKDFDIATSATPEMVQSLFQKTIPIGAHFGVILVLENDFPFEVATFRSEGNYKDGRRPEHVKFATLQEDAERRDFTVNGLYLDIRGDKIIDLVGGKQDLTEKKIRSIGKASDRFQEDHLRMMRAIRFAVQLDFTLEPTLFNAIKAHPHLISRISQERIRDELTKTLCSPSPGKGIRLFDETGLLPYFLPELLKLKGVEQPSEYHPEGDVWIHTLMLLDQLSCPPMELAMGALLHDIAKPETFVRAADRIRFHGHDRIGAEKSEEICKRLTFSNEQTAMICSLVAEHLRFKDAFQMRVSTLKRFLGLPRFDLHLELHRIDCLASHGDLTAHKFCSEKYEEFKKLPPPPTRLVTGHDLKSLGIDPGPKFSEILRAVEDAILEGSLQTKEEAIAFVEKNFLAEKK